MSHEYNHQKAILNLTPDVAAEDFAASLKGKVRGIKAGEAYDDSDSERHVSRHRVGIGRSAVLLAYDGVRRSIAANEHAVNDSEALARVDKATEYLAALDGYERYATNIFVGSQVSNEWLFTQLGIPRDEQGLVQTDYLKYVTTIDPETGEFALSPRTRLNFLEWYNAQLAQLTRETEERKPIIIEQFKNKFRGLIDRGIVPESAAENFTRLDNLELVIDDGPLTSWRGASGTYLSNPEAEVVHLSPMAVNPVVDPMGGTITHELMHAMSGERESLVDASRTLDWHDRSKLYGFENQYGWEQGTAGQIFNEAMTEYLTLAAIDENEPHDDLDIENGEYRGGRQLIALLSGHGLEKIPITYFTAVHFAKGEQVKAATQQLNERLVAAFPGVSNLHGETVTTLLEALSSQTLHDAYRDTKDDYTFGVLGAFCNEILVANYHYAKRYDSELTRAQRLNAIANYYKRTELLRPELRPQYNEDVAA